MSTLLYAVVAINVILSTQVLGQCLSEKEDSPPTRDAKMNLYKGEMEFTLSALDAINKATPNENIFFSPYSIFHATLLAYFGARAQTENSLKNALNLQWAENKGSVMHAYRHEKSSRARRLNNTDIQFLSADRIYLDTKTPLRDCMENLFREELRSLDFAGHPEESRVEINSWIEQFTKGNIKNILPAGAISQATKLVLANAAYFKVSFGLELCEKFVIMYVVCYKCIIVAFCPFMYANMSVYL